MENAIDFFYACLGALIKDYVPVKIENLVSCRRVRETLQEQEALSRGRFGNNISIVKHKMLSFKKANYVKPLSVESVLIILNLFHHRR